ncbi:MAG: galactose mutarotase [Bacteroidetes bacterium]|nr:galactose mutarotase [Bacteroidota bacterium]
MLKEYTLTNGNTRVKIINLGATITSIETPDREGRRTNVIAAFSDIGQYWNNEYYLGCVVGRYANRIDGGRFPLNGEIVQLSVNNKGNHLHGGFEGLHRKVWALHSQDKDSLVLEYTSVDGEEGYPGNLHVRVQYLLDKEDRLSIDYTAVTDRDTPVNLTNHSYFNLSGFDQPVIHDHLLQLFAGSYTEKDDRNLPTGKLVLAEGTPMDFSTRRRIGDRINELPLDKGFDHNYVLSNASGMKTAAELYEPVSGRGLRVSTDRPGIQVYTANWWDGTIVGQQGVPYVQHGAVALETQAFPDSPNHPSFPDTILRPGEVYRTTTIFEFIVK